MCVCLRVYVGVDMCTCVGVHMLVCVPTEARGHHISLEVGFCVDVDAGNCALYSGDSVSSCPPDVLRALQVCLFYMDSSTLLTSCQSHPPVVFSCKVRSVSEI